MDTEMRTMLGEIKTALADQAKIKGAVEQLEEQVKNVPQTIDERLKKVRGTAWDARGNYRGVFANEDQARGFGLFMMAQNPHKKWAVDALKSEFPDVHGKAFDSSDAGNLIPEEYTGRIVNLMQDFGVFERNALRVTLSAEVQRYSK